MTTKNEPGINATPAAASELGSSWKTKAAVVVGLGIPLGLTLAADPAAAEPDHRTFSEINEGSTGYFQSDAGVTNYDNNDNNEAERPTLSQNASTPKGTEPNGTELNNSGFDVEGYSVTGGYDEFGTRSEHYTRDSASNRQGVHSADNSADTAGRTSGPATVNASRPQGEHETSLDSAGGITTVSEGPVDRVPNWRADPTGTGGYDAEGLAYLTPYHTSPERGYIRTETYDGNRGQRDFFPANSVSYEADGFTENEDGQQVATRVSSRTTIKDDEGVGTQIDTYNPEDPSKVDLTQTAKWVDGGGPFPELVLTEENFVTGGTLADRFDDTLDYIAGKTNGVWREGWLDRPEIDRDALLNPADKPEDKLVFEHRIVDRYGALRVPVRHTVDNEGASKLTLDPILKSADGNEVVTISMATPTRMTAENGELERRVRGIFDRRSRTKD